MSYDEMELDMIGDQRTAMFVIISDTDDTFNFVVAIMYTQLFNLLCDKADDEHGGRLINHKSSMKEFEQVIQIRPQEDAFDDVRMEYAKMLKQQLAKGNNGLVKSKYITFAIEAENIREAKPKLERIESDILNNFKILGVPAYPLNGVERLQILYETFNPDVMTDFQFDYGSMIRTGLNTKDYVAPTSFVFRDRNTFQMGNTIGAVSYLQILAPELTDKMLAEFLDIDKNLIVNLHVQSVDQMKAIKLVKSKVTDINRMKIEEQKKAVRAGYDMDIIPSDLNTYGGEAKRLLEDLQSRNERMFLVTALFLNTAKTKQALDNAIFQTAGIAQKYNCVLKRLDYQQEEGLMSSVPLGVNHIPIKRALTTTSTAIFVPFTTQELFMAGESLYYGLNALSNNMIMVDRKKLKNPNGLILGTPGSGKSFAAKREITNAGREGELIFKHVYDLSGSKKPVKRLWISSLEDSAILDGMQHLRSAEEYRHLAEAAVCRSQADWLVGMNATRAYTTKYFKKLTVGRVQTPTLAMLVERAGQISNFQKEKYFNVELDCDGIPAVKPKIFDPDEAEQLRSRCQGSEAIVNAVKETEKKVKAPRLYDLTTLQREANRIYGMTAKQTLDTAQSLYEKKLITYPRTDSQYLTEDMEQTARNVVRQIYEKYQLTGPFDQPEQPDVKKVMNNSKVTDHHAIIPTMELASCHLDELKSWEEKILFLIAVHTVMAMSKDHIYQETEIEVECQGEIFKAKGKIVLQDGWKLFENCFKNKDRMAIVDPDQEMKERMPKVTQGQTFYAVAAEKTEHFTSPPKPYSEDTLLAAMETAGNKEFDEDTEKKGLGTPATRAGIIEKLIYSQYATRKGKQILPTDDGKVLVEILPDFLKSASMTAEWENQLLLMEYGEIAPEQFMTGIKNMLTMMLNGCDAISEEETRRFQTRESIGTCPVCGSLVYESKTNFYCSNHDCHFALWKENRYLQSMEKAMDKKMAAELLKSGSVHVKDLYSKKKNMYFEADLLMDADETGRVNFSLSFPQKKPKNKSKKK